MKPLFVKRFDLIVSSNMQLSVMDLLKGWGFKAAGGLEAPSGSRAEPW